MIKALHQCGLGLIVPAGMEDNLWLPVLTDRFSSSTPVSVHSKTTVRPMEHLPVPHPERLWLNNLSKNQTSSHVPAAGPRLHHQTRVLP